MYFEDGRPLCFLADGRRLLFGIAWLIRRSVPSERAFPGYFLFLLAGSILPSLFCSRIAFQFINWRALTAVGSLSRNQPILGSLAGVPYGWWAYEPDQMLGVFLKPHCDLPIEAVFVWTLGSWTAVALSTKPYSPRLHWSEGWGLSAWFGQGKPNLKSEAHMTEPDEWWIEASEVILLDHKEEE